MISIASKILTISAIIMACVTPPSASATTSNLSLSANKTSVTNGTSLTVSIYESATNVNVVTAKVTYDATKLTCNGASANTADPFVRVASSCGSGNATISVYVSADPSTNVARTVSGSQFVGSLSFTATSDSGVANVSTTAGSQLASNGANVWDGAISAVSVSLAPAPVVTPTPGMGSGSPDQAQTSNAAAAPSSNTGTTSSSSQNSTSGSSTAATTIPANTNTESTKPTPKNSVAPKASATNSTSDGINMLTKITGLLLAILGIAYLLRKHISQIFSRLMKSSAAVVAPAKTVKKARASATAVTAKNATKTKKITKASTTKKK